MMVPPCYNINEIGNVARTNGERPRWTTPYYMYPYAYLILLFDTYVALTLKSVV
jgi:hypothetical protein